MGRQPGNPAQLTLLLRCKGRQVEIQGSRGAVEVQGQSAAEFPLAWEGGTFCSLRAFD